MRNTSLPMLNKYCEFLYAMCTFREATYVSSVKLRKEVRDFQTLYNKLSDSNIEI